MRIPIALCLVVLAVGSLRAETPPLDGTMPEDYLPQLRPLLKEAVERSPTTITASINLATAAANVYSSESSLWPALNASSDYQVSTQSIARGHGTTSKGLYYSAAVSQPIFQWGAYWNQAQIGKLGEKVAEKNFAEAYRLLAVSIREQYIALVGKHILLRNALFSLKLSKENLDAQQARFDSGSSSQAELMNFKMTTEQSQLDADRAEEDFNYSKQVFIRLVGLDTLDESTIPYELPHPAYSAPTADAVLAGFVGGGVESTFQSEVFKMYIKQQDLNYKIAKVRLLPKLSADASLSYANYSEPAGTTVNQVAILSEAYSLNANWTVFDGFATRGAKLASLANKRTYERQLQTYVDSSIDQVSNLRHGLGFSARSMALVEVRTALLGAQVKRLNQDLSLGYASQATIDTGILDLYATEYQQSFARSDFYSRWTEFVSLAGDDPALANLSSRYVR